MTPQEMKSLLKERGARVETYLSSCLDGGEVPSRLRESMLYSLMAGGKRLRPVLCLSCAALCGADAAAVLPFAAAIEMIHTYSLIHDDLPAMDDDDLRRGRPSNHKAFDEATAILAGDALLTDAFAHMLSLPLPPERLARAASCVAAAAGSAGMVGGQMLDMAYTGRHDVTLEQLRGMHSLKTGALLRASCESGALLAGAEAAAVAAVRRYGAALGVAFQIADDILDVTADTATLGKPAGSDVAQGKNTYPALVGLERSRELAQEQARAAGDALSSFDGPEADFLRALTQHVVSRAC
ncbi:MAG: polyprenyl synthetase family protein [Desulfovibrionaceae bacterium]